VNPSDEAITIEELRTLFADPIRVTDAVDFYMDGNIDQRAVRVIEAEGVFVTDVYREGQSNEATDTFILAKARVMGCIVVTLDRDFREIHERIRAVDGLTHAGILFIKSDTLKADPIQLAGALIRIAQKYEGSTQLLHSQLFRL
jgi:predicted nuclease of predicted toxin-antitoxin system